VREKVDYQERWKHIRAMARGNRKGTKQRILYFYLNGELHKSLHITRSEDLMIAWNYPMGKRVAYNLSDVRKNKQHAYTISYVAKMLNRHIDTIKRHLKAGDFTTPQRSYSLKDHSREGRYYFSDDNIREIRDFFKTVHIGRPRKDGMVNSTSIPSRAELEALLRNEKVLYAKQDDGTFIPVWKQPEW